VSRSGSPAELDRRGNSPTWKRIRRAVLGAANWTCQVSDDVTGQPCGAPATVCGHIISRADWPGGPGIDSWSNLRAECRRHSDAGGARIANRRRGEARAAKRRSMPTGWSYTLPAAVASPEPKPVDVYIY
jgi:hypothetical protein